MNITDFFMLYLFENAHLFMSFAVIATVLETVLLCGVFTYLRNASIYKKAFLLLSTILFASAVVDLFFVFRAINILGFYRLSDFSSLLFYRTNWVLNIVSGLSLSLFLEHLLGRYIKLSRSFIFGRFGIAIILVTYLVVCEFGAPYNCLPYESVIRLCGYFFLIGVGGDTVIRSVIALKKHEIPRLLKLQLKIYIFGFMLPQLVTRALSYNPLTEKSFLDTFFFAGLSILLLAVATYYCAFKLMGLRFLNARNRVADRLSFDFIQLLKQASTEIRLINNTAELRHITRRVFSEAFNVPPDAVEVKLLQDENYDIEPQILTFLDTQLAPDRPFTKLLQEDLIITRDEVEFSANCDPNPAYAQAAEFLKELNAEVFLPIFDKSILIGYITIDVQARAKAFYSGKEQDEMAIFAENLTMGIMAIRCRDFDKVVAEKHNLEKEQYLAQHEKVQNFESVRSMVHVSRNQKSGIMFYSNARKFSFGSQWAQELIGCDPNVYLGHPLVARLRKLAQNAEKYATQQNELICIDGEEKLAVTALPNLEKQGVILLLSQASIGDVVKMHDDLLGDTSRWNYLLYLETTDLGRRVNEFFPSSTKSVLSFKISLLRLALSIDSILLDAPAKDREDIALFLHKASGGGDFKMFSIEKAETDRAYARKLFGYSAVYGVNHAETPLLAELAQGGTLLINNVHMVDHETQKMLADFIRYGAYMPLGSEKRIVSRARIICALNSSLPELIAEGGLHKDLISELRHSYISLPRPSSLSKEEFATLVQDFSHLLLSGHPLKKTIRMTERDLDTLYEQKFTSFVDMRKHIENFIMRRNERIKPAEKGIATIVEKVLIEDGHDQDPEINRAILLGKKALTDPQLLAYLYQKLQCQNRIAQLLGVNRSSVYRRLRDLNLESSKDVLPNGGVS